MEQPLWSCEVLILHLVPPLKLGPGARAAQQAGRYFIRDRGEKGPWASRQHPTLPARQAAPHVQAGGQLWLFYGGDRK